MTTSPADPHPLADRLFAAIAAGDVDTAAALYTDDAVIWHNFDQVEQTRDENMRVLRWLTRNVKELRYEDIRRTPIEGGFVQQHVLRGTTRSGATIEVPACIIAKVRDGKVARIDEYLDTAQTAVLQQ